MTTDFICRDAVESVASVVATECEYSNLLSTIQWRNRYENETFEFFEIHGANKNCALCCYFILSKFKKKKNIFNMREKIEQSDE